MDVSLMNSRQRMAYCLECTQMKLDNWFSSRAFFLNNSTAFAGTITMTIGVLVRQPSQAHREVLLDKGLLEGRNRAEALS